MKTRAMKRKLAQWIAPLALAFITIGTLVTMQISYAQELATAMVTVELSNSPGRAIVNARGNHFVVDSPPPLGGPNEAINPLDVILGAFGTCGIFIFETVSQELDIPLDSVFVTVEADFDPRGVGGMQDVNPRLQAFRVTIDVEGPSPEQGEMLAAAFTQRCPIYTTLIRAADIELTVQ